ncbi:hypothetical protein FA95DRAFT_1609260 [Auriscalpium vulgare]|uniref:Uncharacterized protein n=1 Tax=Auriscalpium vulgare TaxID=40419 RepID=A0ACB8RI11_9AGAM|nr:hypothetical protein FA95DRAFT_1609260 [Auriscalpium vulgare]
MYTSDEDSESDGGSESGQRQTGISQAEDESLMADGLLLAPAPGPEIKRTRKPVYELSNEWFKDGGPLDSQTTDTQWFDAHIQSEEELSESSQPGSHVDPCVLETTLKAVSTHVKKAELDAKSKQQYLLNHPSLLHDQRSAYRWLRPWLGKTPHHITDSEILSLAPWAVRPDRDSYPEWNELDDILATRLSKDQSRHTCSRLPTLQSLQPAVEFKLSHDSADDKFADEHTTQYLNYLQKRASIFYEKPPVLFDEFQTLHRRLLVSLSHVLAAYRASDLGLVKELLGVAQAAQDGMQELLQYEQDVRGCVSRAS